MRLKKIKIEGYRSLKSVEWEPAPLNVLIGPNASGKSNLLQALSLLPAAANGTLYDEILRRGGMAPLLWNQEATEITVVAQCVDEGSDPTDYSLRLRRLGRTGSFEVVKEELTSATGGVFLTRKWDDAAEALSFRETALSSRFDREGNSVAIRFQHFARRLAVYHDLRTDASAELRQSAVTRMERQLEPEGQNLIPVLHTLCANDREFKGYIDQAMAAAFPDDYDGLSFPPAADGRVQLRLRWKRSKSAHGIAELSDGTIRFLMLLTILLNTERASLIAIDEPETGLHPGMLPIIAELAVEASAKTQVVISTHSPEFLDAFDETLPAATVFRWVEDHTEIGSLRGEQLKEWVENYSLGKFGAVASRR